MAITKTVSNRFKLEIGKGTIDFSSDTFKAALMGTGFTFDQDSDGVYTDISASIITSAGGYADATLSVDSAWAQDNVNDVAVLDWADQTWTASGADFDDFIGIIVYDDTHASKVIVGYIDLGQTVSLVNGNSFQAQNIGFESS